MNKMRQRRKEKSGFLNNKKTTAALNWGNRLAKNSWKCVTLNRIMAKTEKTALEHEIEIHLKARSWFLMMLNMPQKL